MKNREIIHASELDEKSLTFSDLRFLYSTGRSYTISGSGRNRSTGYRNGVMTPVGDLEISEWSALMHRLIDRAEEREIYDALLQWATENCPWLHNKSEWEQEALQLHSMRIFENPEWTAYASFNRQCHSLIKDGEKKD